MVVLCMLIEIAFGGEFYWLIQDTLPIVVLDNLTSLGLRKELSILYYCQGTPHGFILGGREKRRSSKSEEIGRRDVREGTR